MLEVKTLRRIELDSMVRLDDSMPLDLREVGISDVEEVVFVSYGAISEEMTDMLRWCKDLKRLHFDNVCDDMEHHLYCRLHVLDITTNIRSDKIVNTVYPFRNSLEYLRISLFDAFLDPYQEGDAFSTFTKLRTLRLPSVFLMNYEDDYDESREVNLKPAIHRQLPPNLEVLHIDLDRSLDWWEIDDDPDFTRYSPPVTPCQYVREIYSFLSGIAGPKPSCYPNLRKLCLWNEYHRPGEDPQRYPYQFPPDNDETRKFNDILRRSDILLYVNGYFCG